MDMRAIKRLAEAAGFVEEAEQHQKRDVACLEEIAFLNGWIRKKEIQ